MDIRSSAFLEAFEQAFPTLTPNLESTGDTCNIFSVTSIDCKGCIFEINTDNCFLDLRHSFYKDFLLSSTFGTFKDENPELLI